MLYNIYIYITDISLPNKRVSFNKILFFFFHYVLTSFLAPKTHNKTSLYVVQYTSKLEFFL